MRNKILDSYVQKKKEAYMQFMGIDSFPDFTLVSKHMDKNDSKDVGWGAFAEHFYDVNTFKHKLVVWEDLWKNQSAGDYLLFHEFTHILDTERFVNKDKMRNAMIRGYTEYHAGQVDLLRIAGEKSYNVPASFSIKTVVKTVGTDKTLEEYINSSAYAAIELINRTDFPTDMATFAAMLSMTFNYFGRRSVCKLYAQDYNDTVDMTIIRNFIGEEPFDALNKFMEGFFDDSKVELIMEFFFKMFVSLAQKHNLK